jgi:hypothetical protein
MSDLEDPRNQDERNKWAALIIVIAWLMALGYVLKQTLGELFLD